MDLAPRVLICGDSYMARDIDSEKSPHRHIHWSHHLGEPYQIRNLARSGASNTLINWQVIQGIEEYQPDFVIVGFTAPYRLEYDFEKTSTWPEVMNTPGYRDFYHGYVAHTFGPMEDHRNLVLAQHAVETARARARCIFFLNLLEQTVIESAQQQFQRLLTEQFATRMLGHAEWSDITDPDYCTFHIRDPQVHLDIARDIRQNFLERQT